MNFPGYFQNKLLPILLNRTALFFFVICLLTLAVYTVGTVQGFIDSTQLSLLKLYVIMGILLTLTSFFGFLLDLVRFLGSKKTRYLVRAGGYVLLAVFGSATVLAVIFIITLSGGNEGPAITAYVT